MGMGDMMDLCGTEMGGKLKKKMMKLRGMMKELMMLARELGISTGGVTFREVLGFLINFKRLVHGAGMITPSVTVSEMRHIKI